MSASPHPPATKSPAAGFAGILRHLWLVVGAGCMIALGLGAGLWLGGRSTPAAAVVQNSHPPDHHGHSETTPDSSPDDHPEDHPADTIPPRASHGAEDPASAAAHIPGLPLPVRPKFESAALETVRQSLRPPRQDVFALCDDLIREGNYAGAHDEVQKIVRHATGLHEARGRFRLGLCEEVLGNLNRAQEEYRRVVALNPGPLLHEAALLGQARMWDLSEHGDAAIKLLYRSLLEDLKNVPDSTKSQLPHQLAFAVASRVQPLSFVPGSQPNPLEESFLASPKLTVRPEQVLDDLAGRDDSKTVVVDSQWEIKVVAKFSDSPDEIFLSVRTNRMTGLELVQLVTNAAGWTVTISDSTRSQLLERTLQPYCERLSLGLVLDCVLEQSGLTWRQTANSLEVISAQESNSTEARDAAFRAARRALRMASVTAPLHRWSVVTALELGRVTAIHGLREDALRELSSAIEKYPRSPEIALGWLNLGKLHLRGGDLSKSLESFRRAMDMLGGHPYEAAAYLYVGRIMLEQDAPREAILPLTRAMSLSNEGPMLGISATLLSSAYLMLEHHQRANEILKEQQKSLTSGEIVDVAAFLASLIRFRAAGDQIERTRQGGDLLRSMTNLHLDRCFGGHWHYLAGMAYRDTGMIPEELAVFQSALSHGYGYPLQRRMRAALLDDAPPGTVPEIPLRDETAASRQDSQPVRIQALLARAALAARQGEDVASITHCRELLSDPEVPADVRREALRIMGRVYQLRGDHQRAVDCLTGVVPQDENVQEGPRAQLTPPRRAF